MEIKRIEPIPPLNNDRKPRQETLVKKPKKEKQDSEPVIDTVEISDQARDILNNNQE